MPGQTGSSRLRTAADAHAHAAQHRGQLTLEPRPPTLEHGALLHIPELLQTIIRRPQQRLELQQLRTIHHRRHRAELLHQQRHAAYGDIHTNRDSNP